VAQNRGPRITMMLVLALTAGFRVIQFPRGATISARGGRKAGRRGRRRIIQADQEPENWLSHAATYNEQRFSRSKQSTTRMSIKWHWRGIAAWTRAAARKPPPLVVDGVMYFTTAWSKVISLDAASGVRRWEYDPKVPPEWSGERVL